jgi:hypothetical protein
MAIASQSLFNMTVATDNAGGNQALLMPKLQYRFRVMFINFGVSASTADLTRQVMYVTRPSITFDTVTIPIYNSTVYLAGRHSWSELSINIRDDASGSVSKLVGEQLQKQLDFVEQASAISGQSYKFQTNIEILDGGNGGFVPTVLETWECYGCFLLSANYNNLAYNSSEPVQIGLSIRYDNAVQGPLGTGVGTQVGRAAGTLATGIGA